MKSIFLVSLLVEIAFMLILKQIDSSNLFWSNVIFSIITGLPIGLLTGYITGYYLTNSINNTLQAEALKFYKTFEGKYQEFRVIQGKKPTIIWQELEIKCKGLELEVAFTKRKGHISTPAKMILKGTTDKQDSFNTFYLQESINEFDEGYWGKYEIQLLQDNKIIGHKYHTSRLPNKITGVIEYRKTRIMWKKSAESTSD